MSAADNRPDLSARYVRARKDQADAIRERFRANFAEWLRLRAEDHDPQRDDDGDAVSFMRSDKLDQLARIIVTTPAVYPCMIWQKFEVLEHAIGIEDGTGWHDNREVVMLAGIKADLQAFSFAGSDR